MERENEQLNELPETIIDRLRGEDTPISVISPKIDQIILAEARSQFENREQASSRQLLRPAWVAIAASVAVVILVMNNFNFTRSPVPGNIDDVDHSGRVDIVDVLTLARLRERDPAAISQAQIEALMMQVVSLTKSGEAS